jgi:hypothetical protein
MTILQDHNFFSHQHNATLSLDRLLLNTSNSRLVSIVFQPSVVSNQLYSTIANNTNFLFNLAALLGKIFENSTYFYSKSNSTSTCIHNKETSSITDIPNTLTSYSYSIQSNAPIFLKDYIPTLPTFTANYLYTMQSSPHVRLKHESYSHQPDFVLLSQHYGLSHYLLYSTCSPANHKIHYEYPRIEFSKRKSKICPLFLNSLLPR